MRLYHTGAAKVSRPSLPVRLPLGVGMKYGYDRYSWEMAPLCHLHPALGLSLDAEAYIYP